MRALKGRVILALGNAQVSAGAMHTCCKPCRGAPNLTVIVDRSLAGAGSPRDVIALGIAPSGLVFLVSALGPRPLAWAGMGRPFGAASTEASGRAS